MTAIVEGASIDPRFRSHFAARPKGMFARPNLKLFALAALGVVLVQSLVNDSLSASARAHAWFDTSDAHLTLDDLLEDARTRPCSQLYFEIGIRYERQKNYRKAMEYLRKAEDAESAGER